METGTFTINSAGVSTFCTDKAFIMPEGVTGCICNKANLEIAHMIPLYEYGDVVPARTPLVIVGKTGTYTYEITECDAEPPVNNMLICSFADDEALPISDFYKIFILSIAKDGDTENKYDISPDLNVTYKRQDVTFNDDIVTYDISGKAYFYKLAIDKNNPAYYQKIPSGKAYLLYTEDDVIYKYFSKVIGVSFDCAKVISNMKHYSEREKWFHKLKWLLGRIKSCKCGKTRHIGKLDEDGNESSFIKQLRVLFK